MTRRLAAAKFRFSSPGVNPESGIVMVVKPDDCWICDRKIDGDLAAIGRAGDRLRHVPFVQDLRTSGARRLWA